jgi:hypothetical protein
MSLTFSQQLGKASMKALQSLPRFVLFGLLLILPVSWFYGATVHGATFYTGCGGELVEPANADFEHEVVVQTNQHRREQGLPPLKYSAELSAAARYHAADMALENYFEHDTYDLVDRQLNQVCDWHERINVYYPSGPGAENIARGYSEPDAVVAGWLASAGHRRNIEGAYWEIGVGYYETHWVQDFGRRSGVFPVIINLEAQETSSTEVTLYVYGEWTEMRLRNDAGEWGEWQPFQREFTWQLNDIPGERLVEIELGNATATTISSDTINLNAANLTETPTVTPTPTESTTTPPTPIETPAGSPTPTATPTFTSTTPAPCSTCLGGRILLEGRPPPPHSRWETPLVVKLIHHDGSRSNPPVLTLRGVTSPVGQFQINGLTPGRYELLVKGTHTLQRRLEVTLTTGLNQVDFGLLPEGDILANNQVDLLDFSLLAAVYDFCAGQSGYVESADLNGDGCLNDQDLALLQANFAKTGDEPDILAAAAPPGLTIRNKAPGDRFAVTVATTAAVDQPINGAAFFMNFDPQLLRAAYYTVDNDLTTSLLGRVDNAAGRVDYAAGRLKESLQPPLSLATVTFEVLQPINQSRIQLALGGLRHSDLAANGGSVVDRINGGAEAAFALAELPAAPDYRLHLPLVRR